MERRDEQTPAAPESANLPASSRNLTTPELEAVIRRAVELQSGSSALTDEGISEAEVVRIGQELGLEPSTIRRAMAEVRVAPLEEKGALVALAGERTVRVSRVLRRAAASTASLLDRHLREAELMVAQRRFGDRTRYVQDSSLSAKVSRFTRGFSSSHRPLNLQQLDVAISTLDAESCMVELSIDLAVTRGGLVAGVLGSSGVLATGWAATVWATAIADPLMLIGIPVVGGAWYGMRAIYSSISRSLADKLESLLDRLEHNDLA